MTIEKAAEEIRSMRVRGAAKIGRHAVRALGAMPWSGDMAAFEKAAATLVAARPTAVSLPNAVEYVVKRVRAAPPAQRVETLRRVAADFDARAAKAVDEIGRHGAPLIEEGATVLTICNSQGALAPIFEAARQGRRFHVIALETRPWRQGLLTVGQLAKEGVDASLAVDSGAWSLLRETDLVLTGADSIAKNGDVVNKIGTGGLAVLARERGVPVYTCAETFKIDLKREQGEDVPIEEREVAEVVQPGEVPANVRVRNPVFDVTQHRFLKGYVTEVGVLSRETLIAEAQRAWG